MATALEWQGLGSRLGALSGILGGDNEVGWIGRALAGGGRFVSAGPRDWESSQDAQAFALLNYAVTKTKFHRKGWSQLK